MSGSFLAQSLKALLFPQENACHLCDRALSGAGGCLCSQCETKLKSFKIPDRDAYSVHEPLAACLSAYHHEAEPKRLCHLLKYEGDAMAALPLAAGMAGVLALSGLLASVTVAVPVPLHPSRLRERGYNQAALLATDVCGHTGLELCGAALVRRRAAATQLTRTREERLLAMAGAFEADRAAVQDQCVLLIDDVLTTGATAAACADALLQAGAGRVFLLTACRA